MAANSESATEKKTTAKSKPAAARKAPARKKAASKSKATMKKKAPVKKKAAVKKKPAAKTAPSRKKTAETAGKASLGKSDSGYTREAWEKRKKVQAKKSSEQPLMRALRAEHKHIAGVMKLFGEQLDAIEKGAAADSHVVYEIMDYMVSWPDRYHHPREDLIYGRVAELDAAAADEVDTLQRDHDSSARRGRSVLAEIERWRGGEIAGAAVVKAGREYIDHMFEHMNVEEQVVFPHIESVLTIEDWRDLTEDDQLRPMADPVFGPRVQRQYRNLSRKLRRNVRRTVEKGTMVEWIDIEALMESLEVLTLALESARSSASDHIQAAREDNRDLFRETPLKAPLQSVVNNTRMTFRLLEDVLSITRETLDDLSRLNQDRKDRIKMLDS